MNERINSSAEELSAEELKQITELLNEILPKKYRNQTSDTAIEIKEHRTRTVRLLTTYKIDKTWYYSLSKEKRNNLNRWIKKWRKPKNPKQTMKVRLENGEEIPIGILTSMDPISALLYVNEIIKGSNKR